MQDVPAILGPEIFENDLLDQVVSPVAAASHTHAATSLRPLGLGHCFIHTALTFTLVWLMHTSSETRRIIERGVMYVCHLAGTTRGCDWLSVDPYRRRGSDG